MTASPDMLAMECCMHGEYDHHYEDPWDPHGSTMNCFKTMHMKNYTCGPGNGMIRPEYDYHNPFGGDMLNRTEQELQSECCVHNCYSELQARGMSCGDAGRARDPFDLYDPFAGDWHMVPDDL